MRKAFLPAFLLLAVAAVAAQTSQSASPQQPSPQAVFRGGVDLVTIDVTVIDKDGRPIKGLTPEDFTVKLEGQVRPVRALDFLEFGSAARDSRPATSRQTTNRSAASADSGRVIVLLFDDLSYPPGRGKLQMAAVERMLSKFDSNDLIGFATTSGLGPAINPTRDRSVLVAALRDKRLIGRYDDGAQLFEISVPEAIEIDRGMPARTLQEVANRECPPLNLDLDVCSPMIESHARSLAQQSIHRAALQLSSYRRVIDAVRLAPSPRVVVVFSRGLAFDANRGAKSQLDPFAQAAAQSQVQLYVLTEVPDEIDLSTSRAPDDSTGAQTQSLQRARREEGRFLNSGIQTVASAAGGETFVMVGTADQFLQRIERQTSGFYRLGVDAPSLAKGQQFAATSVAVRQPGVSIRVNRQAFVASAPAEPLPLEDRLKAALAQENLALGVPIALASALRRDPASGELQAAVNVQMPQSVPGPLVAMFGLVDTMGRVVQAGRRDVPVPEAGGAYQLAFPVPVSAGADRLRFVVADAQGNIGSVEHRLSGELLHLGSFFASDLLATWAAKDRPPRFLALETLPDGAESLNAALELYPDDPAHAQDVTVRLALLPEGKETPIFEREITPQLAGATRIASAQLPVASLSAGSYLIRATIIERGAAAGTVSMSLRKTGAASPSSPENTAATFMYFRHWLDLARQHAPGQLDEAVREVRTYSVTRLEGLRGDLEALTALLRNPYEDRLRRLKDYTNPQRLALQEMAFAELGAHTDNRLLRQIALLHTDAAVLPGAVPYIVDPWATTSQGVTVSQDGVLIGLARLAPHLPIARSALASISPNPADDEWVRAWYRATTAHLFSSAQVAALPDHLADRRKLFPDDAGTVFAEGCLYELYASDQIQSAAQAERARGGRTNVPGQRQALLRSRELFGQVSPEAPDHAEARVRLARTNLKLDDARAAAEGVETWLAGPTSARDPDLRYYAYLVLGAARWKLGNATASAVAYEEALKLYPSAQSAIVALLVVKPAASIENAAALLAVLQAPPAERTDPWLSYSIGPGRHMNALMSAVWQSPAIR